ncbi:MAG: PilT/PilU family type 4a pilus ATPase [Candidatus Wallbacteria bacterium]|nr:PilT/PilU family type 4a pilus ATPase [Candidatus Wallbacteria bacterium]
MSPLIPGDSAAVERLNTLYELGETGTAQDLPQAEAMLADTDPSVRYLAGRTVDKLKSRPSIAIPAPAEPDPASLAIPSEETGEPPPEGRTIFLEEAPALVDTPALASMPVRHGPDDDGAGFSPGSGPALHGTVSLPAAWPGSGVSWKVDSTFGVPPDASVKTTDPVGAAAPAAAAPAAPDLARHEGAQPALLPIDSGALAAALAAALPERALAPAASEKRFAPLPAPDPYVVDLPTLLRQALAAHASDIHVGSATAPRVRARGVMVPTHFPPPSAAQVLWLVQQAIDASAFDRLASGADVDFGYDLAGVARFRVSAYRDIHGPGMVLRVIRNEPPSLEDLDAPTVLERFCRERRGLLLVTGPTGSGKSTTLAAMIRRINETSPGHIITIEDPVEFLHKPDRCRITQREVGTSAPSFAGALRSALRMDPDVIMVGELRDLETIEMTLTAAETGHLVIGTLHTPSAPKTIERLINVFPGDVQPRVASSLAEGLLGVVCQVLLPRKDGIGRVAAFEILFRVPAVASLIRDNKVFQIPNVMLSHKKQGMRLLDDDLAELVKAGEVDFDEALPFANDRETFRQKTL